MHKKQKRRHPYCPYPKKWSGSNFWADYDSSCQNCGKLLRYGNGLLKYGVWQGYRYYSTKWIKAL